MASWAPVCRIWNVPHDFYLEMANRFDCMVTLPALAAFIASRVAAGHLWFGTWTSRGQNDISRVIIVLPILRIFTMVRTLPLPGRHGPRGRGQQPRPEAGGASCGCVQVSAVKYDFLGIIRLLGKVADHLALLCIVSYIYAVLGVLMFGAKFQVRAALGRSEVIML
jgi:hypothetical protein